MTRASIRWLISMTLSFTAANVCGEAIEWSGYISVEPRVFVDTPMFAEQTNAGVSPSVVLAPEVRYEWNDGDDRLTLSPYLRVDTDDDERTHADLREAQWLGVRGPWTWRIGLGRVFWGVTESRHLVDIINQTDFVEDIDEEDKLGQPMIALERWTRNAGSFGVFVLPGFRERTFPAADARLRGTLPIDTDRTEYESGAKDKRLDFAMRWTHAVGNWDLGLSGFYGTSREPRLLLRVDPTAGSTAEPTSGLTLIPRYDVIGQFGIDLQYTKNALLWKLEAIGRQGQGKTFAATVAGVEYTLSNLGGTGVDLGLLAEYLFDGRDERAPPTIYDDDWFGGFRLAFNDIEGTAILGGAMVDGNGTFAILEAERRIGEAWKLEAELRWFLAVDARDPLLSGFKNDSFITLRLARYL